MLRNLSSTRGHQDVPYIIERAKLETNNLPQLHRMGVVVDRTSLSRSALYREINAGRLATVKVGRALRITESELQRFISALSKEATSK